MEFRGLADDRQAIKNKWIFKRNTDADGSITINKARLIAKGFSQVAVSASENNVSVIVQTSGLSDADVANIVEAITTNSDYNLENIKIIPVE